MAENNYSSVPPLKSLNHGIRTANCLVNVGLFVLTNALHLTLRRFWSRTCLDLTRWSPRPQVYVSVWEGSLECVVSPAFSVFVWVEGVFVCLCVWETEGGKKERKGMYNARSDAEISCLCENRFLFVRWLLTFILHVRVYVFTCIYTTVHTQHCSECSESKQPYRSKQVTYKYTYNGDNVPDIHTSLQVTGKGRWGGGE